jgi:glutathione S-transferase
MFERDMEKKLAMRAELVRGPIRLVFGYLENLVRTSGGPFVTGTALSIADLVIAAQIVQIQSGKLDGVSLEHLSEYPRLIALKDAYLAEPRVQQAR